MGHNSVGILLTAPHVLGCRWDTAHQLTHHTTPVLSLCTAPLPVLPATNPPSSHSQTPQHSQPPQHSQLPQQSQVPQQSQIPQRSAGAPILNRSNSSNQGGGTQLVWSGATNGSFAAWLVTNADDAELHDRRHSQQLQQPQRQPQQPQLQQQPLQQQRQQQAQPQGKGRQHGRLVWSAEQWHQSGINALHAAPTAGTAPIISPPPLAHPCTPHPHPQTPPNPNCECCCTLPSPLTVYCIAHSGVN